MSLCDPPQAENLASEILFLLQPHHKGGLLMNHPDNIIIENSLCRLVVGSDCIVKSLTLRSTGEECLYQCFR